MKVLLLILTIFTGLAIGQKPPKDFTITYDKFKDRTIISTRQADSMVLYSRFEIIYPGPQLSEDVSNFIFFFTSLRCYGYCFNDPKLIFIIDGERMDAIETNQLSDTAGFLVPRKLMERLASAKLIEFQVGRFEGKWKDKTITRLKTLLDLGTKK